MNPERAAELAALRAMRADDPDDAAEIDSLLADSAEARAAIQDSERLVGLLALSAPQRQPPPALKQSILAATREEHQPVFRLRAWIGSRLVSGRLLAAAAMVASVAFVATLAWAMSLQAQLDVAQHAVQAAAVQSNASGSNGEWSPSRAAMRRLMGSDNAPDARGWLYADPVGTDALMVAYKLPPLDPERAYQLWLVSDGQRVSGGVFQVDPEGYGWLKIHAPNPIGTYQRVGITIEPKQGSAGPTGARVLSGDL